MAKLDFLGEIKEKLRPDTKILKKADNIVKKINKNLAKNNIKAKCKKGGSTAKGTYLKDDFDVDLFVVFNISYRGKDISKILKTSLKDFKIETIHGSRDYYHFKDEQITFEIVPVLDVKNDNIENVTDMSPLHVEWINRKLTDNLRDDIRLAKKFCKAAKAYGAESYISGFSGHVIDILVVYYDGFINLLNAARKWDEKTIIDIEAHWKEPIQHFNKSKIMGPLIVIDPLQKYRNAAAALSKEKFKKFVETAKLFLVHPSKEFFKEKEFDIDKIKKNKGKNTLIKIDIKALDGKTDIIGSKILKIYKYLKKQILLNDFTIILSDWKWDKKKEAQMYFLIKENKLPKTFIRQGPPLKEAEACLKFKEKNKNNYIKDNRVYAEIVRKYRKPEELIKHLIKEDFIVKKVEKINTDIMD